MQQAPALAEACSVCGLVFHVVISTGVLRRHGNGSSHPPCSGSGKRPAVTSHADSVADNPGIQDEEMCCLHSLPRWNYQFV